MEGWGEGVQEIEANAQDDEEMDEFEKMGEAV